ncbi:MAG: hypothetical protein ACI8RZ_001832 [Myxococcota bacterium]|jgi:hypothetical protein
MQYCVTDSKTAPLFKHSRRPQWGPGLLVHEEPTRRVLQFQDGQLRKFKRGYYDLLTPCQLSETRASMLVEELETLHIQTRSDRAIQTKLQQKPPVMPFSGQIQVFSTLFPGGFQDPDYLDTCRTSSGPRFSKRHIDRAVSVTKKKLSQKRLEKLLAAGEPGLIIGSLVDVFKKTSLASPLQIVKPLAAMDADHHAPVALALHALLYGEAAYKKRFRAWLLALGDVPDLKVTWPLATLPAALRHPDKHIVIRRRVFQLQARIIRPDAIARRRPTPRGYRRMREVVQDTHEALIEASLQPADMFDVHHFIWQTLRPKGQQLHQELNQQAAA